MAAAAVDATTAKFGRACATIARSTEPEGGRHANDGMQASKSIDKAIACPADELEGFMRS